MPSQRAWASPVLGALPAPGRRSWLGVLGCGLALGLLGCRPAGPVGLTPTACATPARCTQYLLPPGQKLGSVWGGSASEVWAVGAGTAERLVTETVLRWNGDRWDWVEVGTWDPGTDLGLVPEAGFLKSYLRSSVWGSGPDDVWNVSQWWVADYGASKAGMRPPYGTVRHWDGLAWSTVPGLATSALWRWPTTVFAVGSGGVWGSSASDAWVATPYGGLQHWDGGAWASTSPTPAAGEGVLGLWGGAANDLWAVGRGGAIQHWDGSAWSAVASGTAAQLNRVWGSGPDDVWVVGELGTCLHWDGTGWSAVPTGTDQGLAGIWGSGPADVWAVGTSGTALRWDGGAWATVPTGTDSDLSAVWIAPGGEVWAVGAGKPWTDGGGLILRWQP